jgi:hypothetical protein
MDPGVYTAGTNDKGVQGGAKAVQFQRSFTARDSMDDMMNMRQQLTKDGVHTPFGDLQYSDDVGRWLQRKQQVEETANMDAWFNENFNLNSLADRQLAQQIYPEFYRAREQEMTTKAKEALSIKLIQLRGPQNEQEMYKLYMLNTGRVSLPADWDRIGPSTVVKPEQAEMTRRFRKGLIHLPKLRTNTERTEGANANKAYGLSKGVSSAANYFNEQPYGVAAGRNDALSQYGANSPTLAMNTRGLLRNPRAPTGEGWQ